MRNISKQLRESQAKQIRILIGNYESALGKTKDENLKKKLMALIHKAKQDLENLK